MSDKAPWTTMPQYAKPATVKARKYIRSRTQKRAKEEREYGRLVAIWKRNPANRFCMGCRPIFKLSFPNDTEDCHHFAGRRGPLLLYQPYWIPVCRKCHDYISNNIDHSIALGLRAPKGEWEKMPKAL